MKRPIRSKDTLPSRPAASYEPMVGSTAPVACQKKCPSLIWAVEPTIWNTWICPNCIFVTFVDWYTSRANAGNDLRLRLLQVFVAIVAYKLRCTILAIRVTRGTDLQMRGTTDQAIMSASNVSYTSYEDAARHTSQSPSKSNLHVLIFLSFHLL